MRHSMENGIARLVLAAPPLNILNRTVLAACRTAFDAVAGDHTVRVVILSADGKHFSAGADVGEHLPPAFAEMIPEFLETVERVMSCPVPVIAAVQGRCLGGGFELALAADFILASDDAVFGQPEIALGVLPPAACALLPQWCSKADAAELVLTGDSLNAVRAHQAGIVWSVVSREGLLPAADDLAHRISRHSAAAVRCAKRALRAGRGVDVHGALHAAGKIYTDELMGTQDAVEGLQAFLDKRQPEWGHQ